MKTIRNSNLSLSSPKMSQEKNKFQVPNTKYVYIYATEFSDAASVAPPVNSFN